MEDLKMMDKIRALILKAESTDSQAEKDTFMMKAQELILKHNLDSSRIMAVRGSTIGVGEENIIEEHVKYEENWDRDMFKNVALSNMCKIIYNSSECEIYIIGKETNVNSVCYLISFYRKAILNLAITSAKRKRILSRSLIKGVPSDKQMRTIEVEEKQNITDYLFGAVAGLKDSMEKKESEFQSETFLTGDSELITGGEIIRINRDRIAEYIASKYPNLGYFRGSSGGGNSDSASYSRGYSDGGGLGASQRRLN